jgi:hypothetical protein
MKETGYPLIIPPAFSQKPFSEFDKKEAKEYFKWFMDIREERLEILIDRVKSDMDGWNADYSEDSLNILFEWFKRNITIREKTSLEKKKMQEIVENSIFKDFIKTDNYAFTDTTVSICSDVGLYFGETVARKIPGLKWTYIARTNKFAYYAQPVLKIETSKVVLNPRSIIEGVGGKLLRNKIKENENEFVRLYNVWIENWQV